MTEQLSIFEEKGTSVGGGIVRQISYNEAIEFLLPKHYSGRKPPLTVAFGWFFDEQLKAVCTFGKPPSPSLCDGICGKQYSANVYELNRLCRTDDLDKQLSQFVARCLKMLKERDWIIVSYSDTGMNHHGYIYQACNFVYTGLSKYRKSDWWNGDKHSRSCKGGGKIRQLRTQKHRYVYFATSKKKLKNDWINALNYPIEPYPKGDNSKDYKLGTVYRPPLIDENGNIIHRENEYLVSNVVN